MALGRDTAGHVYAGSVIVAGVAALWFGASVDGIDEPAWLVTLLATAIVIATFKVRLPIAQGQATLSMSYVADFVALLALGPLDAMIVAGAGGAAQCLLLCRSRRSWLRTAFSAAVLTIAIEATWLTAHLAGGFDARYGLPVATTLVAAATFFVVNSGLVAIAVAGARRQDVVAVWYTDFLWTAPACVVGALVALSIVHADNAWLWAGILGLGPAAITLKAYRLVTGRLEAERRHVQEVSALHLASVEALARAIDARDQTIDNTTGDSHVRRVHFWAAALARAAGMADADIEGLKVAALLHDIGKLAVPEHILSKPGRLTPKEFARMRLHPIVGAEIIEAVPFPYPVAPLVRSHHERWDGSGYPDGLREGAIPLGARVLAVADYFDAIASRARGASGGAQVAATTALRVEAGKALDPDLVTLFLGLLPTLSADVDSDAEMLAEAPRASAVASRVRPPQYTPAAANTSPSVFDNIARASHEMRALHDIAQTLGTRLSVDDTMALLTSKLQRLVPGSCWVLFLHDDASDELHARFASGLGACDLADARIPMGAGASGWTARMQSPLVNAHASADFEAAGVTLSGPALTSALTYPLLDGQTLVGVLTAYHTDARTYTDLHQQVLDQVAPQAASVLHNAVTVERLRDASLTDALTQLPNRRALLDAADAIAADRREADASTVVVMIDVNDFKAVNDRHGHDVGDAALQLVARVLRSHIREHDLCARFAGDEFVAVLTGCDFVEGERRARSLQDAIAAAHLLTSRGERLGVTISVGVAAGPDDGRSLPELLAAADRRMYDDKAAGRVVRRAGRSAAFAAGVA